MHTLDSLFAERVERDGPLPALGIKRSGHFRWLSWMELERDVRSMAGLLRRLGVGPGDRVLLASENRYEWIIADLAIHRLGAVQVAVHASLSGAQIAYQARDSGARLALVSTAEQARKLAAADWPAGVPVYSFDPAGDVQLGGAPVRMLAKATGDEVHVDRPHGGAGRVQPNDLAAILYTSGTTGEPKGVMLSHGNLVFDALATLSLFERPRDEVRLCWLPLSHIYARTSDLYVWLASGSRMALAESRETLLADCATVKPTFMNGVPYFYEKVARHLADSNCADEPGALRAMLGGEIRLCCSGGASLNDHAAELFLRQGVPLLQGYGLTETSPVITSASPGEHRLGTVGRPIPGVELRIADDDEVLTRGPHVMQGYWNKPEATAEALRDGWLHTGDLGHLEDGFLRIVGRKKELIVTACGKKIAPAYLEGLLVGDPLVAQAVVVGEGQKFLAALIVPDPANLRAEIVRRQIPVGSPAEALVHPQVRSLYDECLERRLAGVSRDEQVRRFVLLERGFSIESGELTATLKLRRGIVHENFAQRIAELYHEA